MRVLYYSNDDGSFMSRWQYDHFIDELAHYGVTVELFNPLQFSSYNEANERLIEKLNRDRGYSCFMSGSPSTQLFKETLAYINLIGIPKLLICFDNLHAPYMHKEIMPYFDLVWLTSKENEKTIRSWGVKTVFAPYAANPYKFIMPDIHGDIKRLCFIGSPYGTRCMKFNELASDSVTCDVYCGNLLKKKTAGKNHDQSIQEDIIKWKNYFFSPIGRKLFVSKVFSKVKKPKLIKDSPYIHFYDSLEFSEMIKMYHDYALSLNITEVWDSLLLKHPVYKLHLRSFEIPMCGGIEFTTYNEELSHYFEEGKEIIFYHSKEEMIDKAKFYLDDKRAALRTEIKKAARLRSENEHTWYLRFKKVFGELNIKI